MSFTSILISFLITATLGILLLRLMFKGQKRPMLLAAAHGLFAAASFGLITWEAGVRYYAGGEKQVPYTAWIFFIIAITGGLYMFIYDKVIKKDFPRFLPYVHGSAAIAGIIALLLFMQKH